LQLVSVFVYIASEFYCLVGTGVNPAFIGVSYFEEKIIGSESSPGAGQMPDSFTESLLKVGFENNSSGIDPDRTPAIGYYIGNLFPVSKSVVGKLTLSMGEERNQHENPQEC
jgi:hypothetical protein